LIAIDGESKEKVDEMVKNSIDAGGLIYSKPQVMTRCTDIILLI
jgi:predicted lactoylglutathione lyase